tara:strand:- start:220 stop:615 length:396 start_codon:yes stop_codon:yes gene_type:complete
MATTITRTFDATPTDKTYFSLTDNMSSSNLGNIQVPDGSSRISRIDCAFDTPDTKGVVGVVRLSGSNMSEQNATIYGACGDTADAGGIPSFQSVDVNFSVAGVNNIDLQIALQFTTGTATASGGAVTLYFE